MIPLRDLNPLRRAPVITIALIAINVVVFIFQQSVPEELILQFAMRPAAVLRDFDRQGFTLFTSMFLHGDLLHIGSNLLYLWIFGNNIEDRLGPIRFTLFYFICGALAGFAQIAVDPASTIPNVGASGAIAGVLGAYLVLYPNARIQTLIFWFYFVRIIEVSAVWLLGWWFFLQVLNGLGTLGIEQQGGIAFFAHIGGFVAGWLLIRLFAAGTEPKPPRDEWTIPTVDKLFGGQRDDRWWK